MKTIRQGICSIIAISWLSSVYAQGTSSRVLNDSAISYVRTAQIMNRQGRFAEAEKLVLNKALPSLRSAGNIRGRLLSFDVLAEGYYARKRYSEAKWFFIQENMLARKLKDVPATVQSLIGLSRVKLRIKDYSLAIRDLKEADALAKKGNLISQMSSVSFELSLAYRQTGESANAKKAFSRHLYWENSIRREEKLKALAVLRLKSDSVKRSQQVAAKPQKIIEAVKPGKQLYIWTIVLIGLISAVVLLFFLFKRKPGKNN